MSRNISDIDDKEFVEIVNELDSQSHFLDKVWYCHSITGIQCLMPEDSRTRNIDGTDYVWGINIESAQEASYVMNIVCEHHTSLVYELLLSPFLEKVDLYEINRLKDVIDIELEGIKESLVTKGDNFILGYKSEKRGDNKIYFNGAKPTNEICWEISWGAASYRFEYYLKQTRDILNSKAESSKEDTEAIEDPAFKLATIYEKILYFKYSGLYNNLHDQLRSSSKVAKVISQLTGIPSESIRTLLPSLNQGYNKNTRGHSLYKKAYIENTLNALRDTGFDAPELIEIYKEISSL